MKTKTRYLALALVFVFIMSSLIGCGSKSATTWTETFKQTQTMKTGTYDYTFGLRSTEKLLKMMEGSIDESMKQIVTDLIQAEYQMQTTIESMEPMAMSIKFGMKKSGSNNMLPITTIIMKDDAFYVNMSELRECLNSFNNPVVSMVAGMLTTQEDYLKYTVEDINKSLELSGQEAITNFDFSMADNSKYMDKAYEFSNVIIGNFENAVKDITPAPVSNKDGKMILEINKENYEAVLIKICEDVIKNKEIYLDQYIAMFEQLDSGKEMAAQLKEDKQNILDEIQKFCEDLTNSLKDYKLTENDDLNLKSEMSVKGGEGNREITSDFSFNLKSAEDEMDLGIFFKGGGKEKVANANKVTVPEKSVTLDEFTKSLGQ